MKKLLIMLTTLASLGVMAGCNDDDDRSVEVPSAVENAFSGMFPGAANVQWSDRNGYLVATFQDAGTGAQAWFGSDGGWHMTEVDIAYAELPAAVKTAFEAGEYAAWRVDDVDKLLRNGLETLYVLEVEKGEAEFELSYSEEGILLRAVADTDRDDDHEDMLPSELPQTVTDFLQQHYPDARIVDTERERNMVEVEIIDGRTPRELLFTASGEWISTRTEVRQSEVPAVVLGALRDSQYASWEIDDIDHFISSDDEWYLFDLEEPQTDREHELRIRVDGTIF